jgi:micrococcal nuclease
MNCRFTLNFMMIALLILLPGTLWGEETYILGVNAFQQRIVPQDDGSHLLRVVLSNPSPLYSKNIQLELFVRDISNKIIARCSPSQGRITLEPAEPRHFSCKVWLENNADSYEVGHRITEAGQEVQGQVVEIIDGGTLRLLLSGSGNYMRCRLYGIDAPVKREQAYGGQSSDALIELAFMQNVSVILTGEVLNELSTCIMLRGGVNLNQSMIEGGHAWANRDQLDSPYKERFINAEAKARELRLGLWEDINPMPPWHFREKMRLKALYEQQQGN